MIKLQNISIAYEKTKILSDITCTFNKGEFVCVIGKNGCGKSTLLRAIAGLMPYHGSIFLDGHEIKTLSKSERAKRLSYLPQIRPIPAMDVETLISHGRYPHLGFSKTLTEDDFKWVKKSACIAGVEDLLMRDIRLLSGGERQRAYIAMTVAQNADMMLLDEPTTYLDIEHQLEVMELLTRLHRNGKGIIMVAHDLPQAFSYADRIILLADGFLAENENPAKLCKSKKLQDAMSVSLQKATDFNELYSYRLTKGGDV